MPGSVRLGTIAGVTFWLHASWLLFGVLLTCSLAMGWFAALSPAWSAFTSWGMSILAVVLLFVSVLFHELVHALSARARGLPTDTITLFVFGGISNSEQEPKRPVTEFQLAFIGPLISLLLAGGSYLLWIAIREKASPLAVMLSYLTVANALLGVFNLIPAFPLDGGRVLRSIIWAATGSVQVATRLATLIGQGMASLLILGGIWVFFAGDTLEGIWVAFLGWLLFNGAQFAGTQFLLETMLKGKRVSEIMNANSITVSAAISLQKLVYELFLPQSWRSAFVTQGEHLVGLITLHDIRPIPQEQWAETTVGQVMLPLNHLHWVSPQQSIKKVLSLMVARDVNQLPVVQDGRLVGVVRREDILRFVEVRHSLGLEMEDRR